jgi:hypothetical protein
MDAQDYVLISRAFNFFPAMLFSERLTAFFLVLICDLHVHVLF